MALNAPFVATNTAPTGTENTGVTRSIFRKNTTIETTTPLPANGVFTGSWHDSQAEGTVQVLLSSFSDRASAASGFVLQETEDLGNPNFTRTIQLNSASANSLSRLSGTIRSRYWRVTYTNGALAQAVFELTSCATNISVLCNAGDYGLGASSLAISGPIIGIVSATEGTTSIADNVTSNFVTDFPNTTGSNPLRAFSPIYGGAFSGTASAARQGWSRPRTPTVFKQATATASGNTALWTPGSNNKFRLLAFKIQLTSDATLAVAGRVTIGLQDSTTDLGLSHVIFIPSVALNTIQDYDSGWITLGSFGILSAAANNVLNINLSSSLATGVFNVVVAGTEE